MSPVTLWSLFLIWSHSLSYSQFISVPRKGPGHLSLSTCLSPGTMWARKTAFEKDGCFLQSWGFWDWMMMGPFLRRSRRQPLEQLCSWACWGEKIQLLWETGLHNLLHFLGWNVVKPLRIWCADRVQLCVSLGALYRHSCSPLLAQIIKTWLFLATGFWKPCPFNWMYVCFCCCETQK